MNPYTRPFVVVALLVLSLIPSAAPLRAADSSSVTVSPKVRKDVASGDRTRVLVQLRLPGRGHVPEGRLTHAAASLQRSDIAKSALYPREIWLALMADNQPIAILAQIRIRLQVSRRSCR